MIDTFYKNLDIQSLTVRFEGQYYTEEWANIPLFEGKYMISNFGRVKSLRRATPFIMKQYDSAGYLKVDLYDNWERKKSLVHILVATSFIDNAFNKPEVNHKKGLKKVNFFKELEWFTSKENTDHAYSELDCKRRGKNKSTKGVIQLTTDGSFIKEWDNLSQIKKELGFDWSTISRCCRGLITISYGFKWQYKAA